MPIVELFTLPTINILRDELNFSVLSQILFLIQVVWIYSLWNFTSSSMLIVSMKSWALRNLILTAAKKQELWGLKIY